MHNCSIVQAIFEKSLVFLFSRSNGSAIRRARAFVGRSATIEVVSARPVWIAVNQKCTESARLSCRRVRAECTTIALKNSENLHATGERATALEKIFYAFRLCRP
jgi:hypothetical protein